ncbi:MAG: hypothetical protein HC941_04635 [Microcoleus sp. SU_5_3]|nr:hypothetical protein [Microcoleus sp. SU_5_3]NJL65662.1 hypothetical protein [Microcoleus sp. SM1_3_4]
MRDWNALKSRYLQDELPVCLENLVSNLARIKFRCQNAAHSEIIEDLLQESKLFIEWTAANTEIEIAAELVKLQVQLACWQYSWAKIRSNVQERIKVSEQVKIWSEKVLNMSGLLAAN